MVVVVVVVNVVGVVVAVVVVVVVVVVVDMLFCCPLSKLIFAPLSGSLRVSGGSGGRRGSIIHGRQRSNHQNLESKIHGHPQKTARPQGKLLATAIANLTQLQERMLPGL